MNIAVAMRPSALDAPLIALNWLARIRWLAVIGQVAATLFAATFLDVQLPLVAVFIVIGLTFITNVLLVMKVRTGHVGPPMVIAVVLLDVFLLTLILALTGGPNNPFCTLYIIHVVLGVMLLGEIWTWVVVGLSTVCFAMLFFVHDDITVDGSPLPAWARNAGMWISLALVSVLIAYFIGRLHRELRQRDRQLSAMRERTERSARFAAVTALAAGAAHELGSPLGTIAVVAKELEIASAKMCADPEIVEDAKLIRTEVDRCRGILAQMRLEVGDDLRYEAHDITPQEFIEGAISDLTDERKARVVSEAASDLKAFYLGSRAILRAVGVLLRNGFEASPPNEKVYLRMRRVGEETVVEVQDRGTGMPADVLARAGEPFFTTKEMGRGMGMGLFLVKLVVENNDGRVELQSEPGKGTLARLYLPGAPLRQD